MRVVITGASGNVGTSVISALEAESAVDQIIGIARRIPDWTPAKTEWVQADVASDDLLPHLKAADAVIHLAWAIQPSRSLPALERTNLTGSRRVFEAASRASVGAIIYGSSIGAYSPATEPGRQVDESWPTGGIQSSWYSRHKAAVESMLTALERDEPGIRVARLRPALIFKADAASEIARYFAGPFMPRSILRPGLLPIVPGVKGLVFQAVHSLDVGDAYRRVLVSGAQGAFNLAADPPIDSAALAAALGGRSLRLSPRVVRGAAAASWRLRLQPTSPDWLDLALRSPLISSDRARSELGWEPRRSATETLAELLDGIRHGRGMPTPPLVPRAALRAREILTGVGASNP